MRREKNRAGEERKKEKKTCKKNWIIIQKDEKSF